MTRITEKELILPALFIINKEGNQQIDTSQLIQKLEELLEVSEEDQQIISGRKDSYFSQKVRNLKSHNTLTKNNYATYEKGIFTITDEGQKYLEEHEEQLKLIIAEEKFLNKNASIITEYFTEFNYSIDTIRQLSKIDSLPTDKSSYFFSMLYSSSITSLETYLSDALKYNLKNNHEFLIKFVETFQDFKNTKCDFNEIFNLCDTIETKVEEGLGSLLYHNLPKIKGIYKDTFDINFQGIDELMKSISIRHDLIHRNGKQKDGTVHEITKENVLELCEKVIAFVEDIEEQFDTINTENVD